MQNLLYAANSMFINTMLVNTNGQSKMYIVNNADTFDIITKLKFIGSIQTGEKINVKNMSIQPKGLITAITRFLSQESREDTIAFINCTMTRSIDIIKMRMTTEKIADKRFLINTISDIIKALQGVKNLQETYSYDTRFRCFMETTIQDIESKLEELRHDHPEYFKQYDNTDNNDEL